MKLTTLASTIVIASSALLTSCGSSSSETSPYTYFNTLNGVTLTADGEYPDLFNYMVQILSISNCYASTSNTSNGTESGTCTLSLRILGGYSDEAVNCTTTTATYTYTPASGQLTIGNIYYTINSQTTAVNDLSLNVTMYSSNAVATITPNTDATINGTVYTMLSQSMNISQ